MTLTLQFFAEIAAQDLQAGAISKCAWKTYKATRVRCITGFYHQILTLQFGAAIEPELLQGLEFPKGVWQACEHTAQESDV